MYKRRRNIKRPRPPKVIPGKDIQGFEGIYRITPDGKIWSYKLNDFRATCDHGGVEYIQLHKDKVKTWHSVGVLVLEAYVCKRPFPEAVAMHIDGKPFHNTVDNLKWSTNQKVMSRTMRGENNNKTILKDEDVLKIRTMYAEGIVGRGKQYSLAETGKMFGISRPSVWRIIHRYTWTHI